MLSLRRALVAHVTAAATLLLALSPAGAVGATLVHEPEPNRVIEGLSAAGSAQVWIDAPREGRVLDGPSVYFDALMGGSVKRVAEFNLASRRPDTLNAGLDARRRPVAVFCRHADRECVLSQVDLTSGRRTTLRALAKRSRREAAHESAVDVDGSNYLFGRMTGKGKRYDNANVLLYSTRTRKTQLLQRQRTGFDSSVWHVALSGNNAAWTTFGRTSRTRGMRGYFKRLDGGRVCPLPRTVEHRPFELTDEAIYVRDEGRVLRRIPLPTASCASGGPEQTVELSGSADSSSGIAISGDSLYYTTQTFTPGPNPDEPEDGHTVQSALYVEQLSALFP
jgi:hypothetical protein